MDEEPITDEELARFLEGEARLQAMTDAEMEELAFDPVEPSEVDPDGWRYYSDVLTPETIAWKRRYLELHPDDEFMQQQVANIDISDQRVDQRKQEKAKRKNA